MISFITSEAGMSLIGLMMGWFFRYKTDRDAQILNLLSRNNQNMNDADGRANRGGWNVGDFFRGALLALIIISFLSVILAGFANVPVVLETMHERGWWFWKKPSTEFVEVNGVFFPPEIRKSLMLMMAFFLGQIRNK